MNKYGLVGKNISHSLSPDIYKKIIGPEVIYDLLDYSNFNLIPKASDLLNTYTGINITSPYKEHFLKEVNLIGESSNLNAINCLRKRENKIEGVNTDFLGIMNLLKTDLRRYKEYEVVILGDGAMSRVVQYALMLNSKSYKVHSRKLNSNFKSYDYLSECNGRPIFLINTCAREFDFHSILSKESFFWDLNYLHANHSISIPKMCTYLDGFSLLQKQAEFAVLFWSEKI
jgi:shikimate dehydrogenase